MEKSLNGSMLRKMFLGAASALSKNKDIVDKLNVFPVPDGDTGTNMSLTMQSVVKELSQCMSNNISDICVAISKGALKGARGNSGVILSQICKGMMTVLSDAKEIDAKVMAKAFKQGSDIAYKAVSKPQEGTMLTVIRDIATAAKNLAKKSITVEDFLSGVLEAGSKSLKSTPEKLPILAKAGVVDSGGQGLLFIVQGFYNVVLGREVDTLDFRVNFNTDVDLNKMFHENFSELANIEFAYCTEFFCINLHKKTTEADIDKFRESLNTLGDCVLVIGDLSLVKVHVHTNQPGKALTHALTLGEVDSIKIENMMEQNRVLVTKRSNKQKQSGMVAVCAGEGLTNIFKEMLVDIVLEGGQTMNPSADEIANACSRVGAKDVFVLPNNKNIILAAEQAKSLVTNCNIHVIPTLSIPQGLSAVLGFNPDEDVENNFKSMASSFEQVKYGMVTYAVRDTSADNFDLKVGDIIGINSSEIAVKGKSVSSVTADLVDEMIDDSVSNITLYFGSEVGESDVKKVAKQLSSKYTKCDVDFHQGGQPLYYYIVSME
ncbi:MAG: DAK2 domain-containing protein [Clostridiales bacterium]|jgi:DAK2 domain fusion protein YloV|nr:DAK2 domain-containing protein [Clostridiales bacterium]